MILPWRQTRWPSLPALPANTFQSPVLPASAVQLANRAAALERLAVQGHVLEHAFAGDGTLTADEMLLAASEMTSARSRLNPDEQSKYANMVERLHERIIGQDEAVLAVSRAVKVARVGLRDPKRPIGSFCLSAPAVSAKRSWQRRWPSSCLAAKTR